VQRVNDSGSASQTQGMALTARMPLPANRGRYGSRRDDVPTSNSASMLGSPSMMTRQMPSVPPERPFSQSGARVVGQTVDVLDGDHV